MVVMLRSTAAASARIRPKQPVDSSRGVRLLPRGGLIAIGGPPFAGRGALAAMLAEWLPFCSKLETQELLTREVFAGPRKLAGRKGGATAAILDAASERLKAPGPKRTVIVAARFERPAQRAEAYARAKELSATFLYVEARSSNIRSIRRLFRLFDPAADPQRQIALYESAVNRYVALSGPERRVLPHLVLRSVLSDLDDACEKVVRAWTSGPA